MLQQEQLLRRGAVIAAFTLSCFGLLLFLWTTFGGPIPLAAKGYRVRVDFEAATQLAVEADVRVAGVRIGKVATLHASPDGRTRSVIEIDRRYAPLRQDVRAQLRAKSLLGETYIALTPGNPGARTIPDGGVIPTSAVAPSVQLDEIMRTFDPRTRVAFGVWMQQQALAGAGRGRDISDSFAQFAPLEERATGLLKILDDEAPQLTQLVGGTGRVFSALSARGEQLQGLIDHSQTVFTTTAARNRELAATFVAFPTFERESRKLITRVASFRRQSTALIAQLTPAFREFSGTLRDTRAFAPQLRRLVTGLGSAQGAALDGIPAAIRFLDGLRRFTGALPSALANLNPILGYIGAYRQDLVALVANLGLAAEGFVAGDTPGTRLHNLRGMAVIGPDGLASYPNQLASARKNPYARPGSVQALRDGLTVFDDRHCTGAPWPKIVPGAGLSPLTLSTLATSILGDGTPIAPPCKLAPPRGGGTRFPQLVQDALPTIP